jgi:hypothetical protein
LPPSNQFWDCTKRSSYFSRINADVRSAISRHVCVGRSWYGGIFLGGTKTCIQPVNRYSRFAEAGDPVKLPIRTDNAGQGFQGFWRPTA